jgi:AAA15 family ATPase/GTPase
MYIKQVIIKNFRNLKEVNLYNLGNLLILIGENGSGKTNIFEALDIFFNHFDYPHEQNKEPLTSDNCYLWFDMNTNETIEFQVTLGGLSGAQTKKLAEVANVKQQKGDLTINRSIILRDNNVVYCNDLIQWGAVSVRKSETGYSIESESDFDPNAFVQTIIENILKNTFTYIPISRGTELRTAHGSILTPEVRQELVSKGGDNNPRKVKEWNKTRQTYRDSGWTPGQLECRGSQLSIQYGTTPIPYELEGSGYQALFNLLRLIEMGGQLIAIEEPENHFHPKLQKTFVGAVKEIVGRQKQVFLSTHSPFIIDRVNLNSIWFVYKDGLESKVQNASSLEQIGSVFQQLGVRPSDLLLANGMLIVEGTTDKNVYADWARKIGEPYERASIIIIDAEGAGNIKKYLLSEAIQKTCLKTYALCDANSESSVKKAVKGIVSDENVIALNKGDIEDYYSREIVVEFAKELAVKKGKPESEIPTDIKSGETVKTLNKLFDGDWWKLLLAARVIEKMEPRQIDGEIRSKLTQIYDAIY